VAIPMGQLPELHTLYFWHPRAIIADDATATASAPIAMALMKSLLQA